MRRCLRLRHRTNSLAVAIYLMAVVAFGVSASRALAEMTGEQEVAITEIFTITGEGQALFGAGQFAQAETIFRRVLQISETHFPGEGLTRASALHNLAAAVAEQGRYSEAAELAAEALRLRQEGEASAFALSSSQALLASILRDLGRRAAATDLMRQAALSMAGNPDTPISNLTKTFSQFLGMLAEDGRFEEAARVADQLAAIVDQVDDVLQVEIYWAIARLRSEEGNLSDADRFYRLAYAALAKVTPENPARRAILISNIASILREQFRAGEAEQLFRRAVADLDEAYPDGHPALATALDGLALAIAEQDRPGEAWPIGRRALDIRLAFLPENHPLIATSLVNLGLSLFRDRQLETARDAFQSAVTRRLDRGDEVGAARAAVNLAVAQHALGDTGGGVESLEKAREVFAQALPDGHPTATTAAIDQAWLLLALGQNKRALNVARQAAEALIAARAFTARSEGEATPVDKDKRRLVVNVAAAWEVSDEP